MLINILVIILATIAIISFAFAVYYHFEFRKACQKGFLVSSYNLELLDQKKTVGLIIATITVSSAFIIGVLKQNYTGG